MDWKKIFYLGLALVWMACLCGAAESKQILFIGNSYTAQTKGALLHLLKSSPYQDAKFEFITKGGATLQKHLQNPDIPKAIRSGDWDFVVLQEQSQTPALPGEHGESFQDSVGTFSEMIRKAGATPVLFMTWGRRDGDKRNLEIYPDYVTMQRKLADAYRRAACRNRAILAPVGEAWSLARESLPDDGKGLYRNDGSHPSGTGAFLGACVFFRVLFQDDLEHVRPYGMMGQEEAMRLLEVARQLEVSPPHSNSEPQP